MAFRRAIPSRITPRRLCALCLGVGTLWLAALPGNALQEGPEALFARAVQLHQSGDVQGAVKLYKAVLEVSPRNVEVLSNLGAAYARLGRYEDAIEQYQKALEEDPEKTAVRFNLGVAYYKAAKTGDAARELAQVVAAEPKNLNAVTLLSDCHLRRGEYKKVIDLLAPLEATAQSDRAVLYLLGTALIRDQRVEQGQALIDKILRQGDSAEARVLLGAARMMGRDYPGSVKEFQRAIELNPNLPTASSFYGRALLATGNRDQAVAAFQRELSLNPTDFDSNFYLGVLRKQDHNFEEALPYLQRALQSRPGAAPVRYQIGSLYLAVGDLAGAQRLLEELVQEVPDFAEAHVSLATVYYRMKRKADGNRHRAIAQKLAAEAQARISAGVSTGEGSEYRGVSVPELESAGGHPRGQPATTEVAPATLLRPRALETSAAKGSSKRASPAAGRPASETAPAFDDIVRRATEAREASRLEEAIDLYGQALQVKPSWAEGWWYLGTLYYEADRFLEGRDAFRRLVGLKPKGAVAWAMLGLCEYQTREYERALEHLQKGRALGLMRDKKLTLVVRYRVALLLNRFDQAEAALEILYALAREWGDTPDLIEALGLSSLALPYLPIELPPDKREVVLKAGHAAYHVAARRMNDARREYLELVARYPNTPGVHYSYGVFLLLGEPDAALDELRKELEISPSSLRARLQIAFEYIKRGDYPAGHPYAEQAVAMVPRSFAARNALGRILLEMDRTDQAIKELETGVSLAPDSPETRYLLARAYKRAGRAQEAERERAEFTRLDKLRRALKEGPRSPGAAPSEPTEQP